MPDLCNKIEIKGTGLSIQKITHGYTFYVTQFPDFNFKMAIRLLYLTDEYATFIINLCQACYDFLPIEHQTSEKQVRSKKNYVNPFILFLLVRM